jgi:hypothetical protein
MMMNKMNRPALAIATAAVLGAAGTSPGYAGESQQGPLLSGIVLRSLEPHQPLITAIVLPSGETVNLRQQTTDSSAQEMTITSWVDDHEGCVNGGLKKTPTE